MRQLNNAGSSTGPQTRARCPCHPKLPLCRRSMASSYKILFHAIGLAAEDAEEFFAFLLCREDRVLVGRIGFHEGKVVVAEPLDLFVLGLVLFGIEVLGVVGDPQVAAAIERL